MGRVWSVWLVVCLSLVMLCGLVCGRPPAQSRARSTRGFKNVALSTARGFGKRGGGASEPSESGVRVKTEWLVRELTENPELARLLVQRFIDRDSDGFLSPRELLAENTSSGRGSSEDFFSSRHLGPR